MPKKGSYGGGGGHHSAQEAKAYNMGRAYGAAKAGRKISGLSESQKKSFKKGYNVGKGGKER